MQGEDGLDEAGDPGGRAPEFAQEPPGLEGGDGLLDKGPDLRVGPVGCLLARGEGLPPAPVGDPDRSAGTAVSLVRPAARASAGQGVDDAVLAGRADVVDGPGQGRRGPQQPAEGIGQDLHVHPVPLVLPRVVGPVGGDPVDRQQGAVEDHERFQRRGPCGFGEGGREGGQERDGLGDVPVRGGRSDAEPGRELGIRVAVAEVGEGEQGLPARAQAPPAGTELPAVFPQAVGEEAQGGAGHVDAGRVDKHTKPLVETVLLGRKPIYQGLHLSVSPTGHSERQVGKRSVSRLLFQGSFVRL